MVLYLKDESSMHLDEVYKIHYYSQISQPSEDAEQEGPQVVDSKLFRFEPCNLYQDEAKRQMIKDYLHLLSQFNVHMELGIEGSYCGEMKQNLFTLIDGQLIELPKTTAT